MEWRPGKSPRASTMRPSRARVAANGTHVKQRGVHHAPWRLGRVAARRASAGGERMRRIGVIMGMAEKTCSRGRTVVDREPPFGPDPPHVGITAGRELTQRAAPGVGPQARHARHELYPKNPSAT
jgi:hypothetical protein